MLCRRHRALLILGLFVAALAGPAAGQSSRPALSEADLIRMADEVEQDVERIRGWKFKKRVERKVYTEPELRKFIEKKLFEEELGGGRLERTEALLRVTGVIPETCDLRKTYMDVLLNQIGGFYDPETNAFYMLNRQGVDYGPLLTRVLVAHELTHALDDQYVDLDKLLKASSDTQDAGAAIGAVVEGSATVLMSVYMLQAQSSGKYDAKELSDVMEAEMKRSQAFLDAPLYFQTIVANYMCGMYFYAGRDMQIMMGGGETDGIADRILQAARKPPTSSEQILHPDKYWSKAERDEPVLVRDADVEPLLERDGWHIVHRDTLGELLCGVAATPADRKTDLVLMGLPTYWITDASAGWGGDRVYLLAPGKTKAEAEQHVLKHRGTADVRAVWITLWDRRDDRDEFLETYGDERDLKHRRASKLGQRGAVFFFNVPDEHRAALEARWKDQPPAFTRDGKAWPVAASGE